MQIFSLSNKLLLINSCLINIKLLSYAIWILLMITEKLGKKIKKIRLKLQLSQEKFALSIAMDRTYFASVESGKRNISIKNIEKIAKGLNITLEELFKGM